MATIVLDFLICVGTRLQQATPQTIHVATAYVLLAEDQLDQVECHRRDCHFRHDHIAVVLQLYMHAAQIALLITFAGQLT